jgi:hypothetical protein
MAARPIRRHVHNANRSTPSGTPLQLYAYRVLKQFVESDELAVRTKPGSRADERAAFHRMADLFGLRHQAVAKGWMRGVLITRMSSPSSSAAISRSSPRCRPPSRRLTPSRSRSTTRSRRLCSTRARASSCFRSTPPPRFARRFTSSRWTLSSSTRRSATVARRSAACSCARCPPTCSRSAARSRRISRPRSRSTPQDRDARRRRRLASSPTPPARRRAARHAGAERRPCATFRSTSNGWTICSRPTPRFSRRTRRPTSRTSR